MLQESQSTLLNKKIQIQTRQKVLKVAISWAKGEQSWLMRKLIGEKVVWWESCLMRKLIDEKVVWWESCLMRKLYDEKVVWRESWLMSMLIDDF